MDTSKTMYTPDEVIDDLQETRGVPAEVIVREGNTVTREYAAFWEMGHGRAHKTGWVEWLEIETLDEDGEPDRAERAVLNFTEN